MINILCFGDSNTYGFKADDNSRFEYKERWTGILQKALGEKYQIFEAGLSGRTTVFDDPLTEDLAGVNFISSTMLSASPLDLLIIMLGTNDIKERFMASPESIAKGLSRLVKKAIHTEKAFENKNPLNEKGKQKILIMTPLVIDKNYENIETFTDMGAGCYEKSKALAPLYEKVANELGTYYFDLSSIAGMSMHKNDCIHLTKESHALLGNRLAEVIREIFE